MKAFGVNNLVIDGMDISRRLSVFMAALLCLLLPGCLITTPRTVITVSGFNAKDAAKAKRVCVAVAVRHGMTIPPNNDGMPPDTLAYKKASDTMFGRHSESPSLFVTASPAYAATVVIGDSFDTAERKKLAEDTLIALQREFGRQRVQRRDDRWTEF